MATPSDRLFFVLQSWAKYVPFEAAARLRGFIYRPFFARVGRRLRIYDAVTIKYPGEITLGDHVTINSGSFLVGAGGLAIGSDVMIGAGTKIVTTAHGRSRTDVPMRLQELEMQPIVIEEDVWFGFDVKVLPGAVIRRGAVLGAGTVVGGEVPAFAIVAGVPGKVIGTRRS